jgi:hypothetical protein
MTKLDRKFDGTTILDKVEHCIDSALTQSLGILSVERVNNEQQLIQLSSTHNS